MSRLTYEEKQYIVSLLAHHRCEFYEFINDATTSEQDREVYRSKERILHKALREARALGFNVNERYTYEEINQRLNYTDRED